MLEYDRIDVSEGIYVNKISDLHECTICHYWYFLTINFRFQPKVCDDRDHMAQKPISFDDTGIVTMESHDYRISVRFMAKNEAIDRIRLLIYMKQVGDYDYEKNNLLW